MAVASAVGVGSAVDVGIASAVGVASTVGAGRRILGGTGKALLRNKGYSAAGRWLAGIVVRSSFGVGGLLASLAGAFSDEGVSDAK